MVLLSEISHVFMCLAISRERGGGAERQVDLLPPPQPADSPQLGRILMGSSVGVSSISGDGGGLEDISKWHLPLEPGGAGAQLRSCGGVQECAASRKKRRGVFAVRGVPGMPVLW